MKRGDAEVEATRSCASQDSPRWRGGMKFMGGALRLVGAEGWHARCPLCDTVGLLSRASLVLARPWMMEKNDQSATGPSLHIAFVCVT